ncbi:MAG: hypothetical protein ACI840_002582 [Ulvibacter sp.]|jgi:hypothetical protein
MNAILIHPSYFPSILQMVAVSQAKNVVLEVHGNYQKQTYRNRTYIAHNNGRLLLNIPIKHNKKGSQHYMSSVIIENDFPWQSHHWKSIRTAYRTSPFFEYYEDDLQHIFTKPVSSLLDLNIQIFDLLCDILGIEAVISKTQEYEHLPKTPDLRSLIEVKSSANYKFEIYTQVLQEHHEFLPNLSVLDLLFNEGPNALNYLETQNIAFD